MKQKGNQMTTFCEEMYVNLLLVRCPMLAYRSHVIRALNIVSSALHASDHLLCLRGGVGGVSRQT